MIPREDAPPALRVERMIVRITEASDTAMIRVLIPALLIGSQIALLAPGRAEPAANARTMQVLDRYMDALNALDIEGHVATYHFPHFRLASGEVSVWTRPEHAMPLLALPTEERRARLRESLGSEWTRREIVQSDPSKVHVATRFVRLRADGSEIAAFDSLYILTLQDGRWGIKGRSSFAP